MWQFTGFSFETGIPKFVSWCGMTRTRFFHMNMGLLRDDDESGPDDRVSASKQLLDSPLAPEFMFAPDLSRQELYYNYNLCSELHSLFTCILLVNQLWELLFKFTHRQSTSSKFSFIIFHLHCILPLH